MIWCGMRVVWYAMVWYESGLVCYVMLWCGMRVVWYAMVCYGVV